MPEYLSPGVYVEEIDRGPKPIEGVGTAMAVFVGFSEKAHMTEIVDGEVVTHDLFNKPQLVTNWSQYVERFGGFVEGAYMPHVRLRLFPERRLALLRAERQDHPAGTGRAAQQRRQARADGARQAGRASTACACACASTPRRSARPRRPIRRARAKTAKAEAAPVAAAAPPGAFNITVEREKTSGGWSVQEDAERRHPGRIGDATTASRLRRGLQG